MKTILLHVSDEATLDHRLQSALAVARCFGSHLRCLQVTPMEAYVAMNGLGGMFVMGDLLKAIEDSEATLRRTLEERLPREGVSWDFQQTTGSVAHALASYAALCDLVVTSRIPENAPHAFPGSNVADIVQQCRTPVLVPAPDGTVFDPLAPVLIAWNRSFEAAHAIKGALPLLRQAAEVHVLTVVHTDSERPDFPGTMLLEYLSRHDVHAELHEDAAPRHDVADRIVSGAREVGAGTVVMGAYGHSRIGEYWLGGVTRRLLRDAPVAVITGR